MISPYVGEANGAAHLAFVGFILAKRLIHFALDMGIAEGYLAAQA